MNLIPSKVPAALLLALVTCVSINAEESPATPAAPATTPAPAPVTEAKEAVVFRPAQLLKDGRGATAVARALTETFMSEEEFKAEVAKVKERYADFEKDTQRDMSHYLNDRLVIHGLAAANGKVEKIKKGLVWLSMYGEFQQPAPAFVEKFIKDNIDSLNALFHDFNWDRASNYIKNREWRKKDDAEDKKTASAE